MKNIRWLFCTTALLIVLVGVTEKKLSEDAQTVSHVLTSRKVVALTIDDGPHYKTTPKVLAILKEKQVKATFFVLGKNVEHFPKLLVQEVNDGHEIGSHTYSHRSLLKLKPNRLTEEFEKAEKAVAGTAPKPTLFRPPNGFYNSQVIETAHQRGYTVVLWSIDPRDWSCPPKEIIVERVLKEIKPGSIVLLHDGQYPLPTPEALGILIDRLREQGYQFVTISDLLQYNEIRHSFSLFDYILR